MFQYGYTNFQQKGYHFASENAFFHTTLVNRNAKLAQIVNHVDTAHTAYNSAEPAAYLGIFTDLDSNQENPRYYFQRSGRMRARNAAYAQGYVQDVSKEKDDDFFREPFLRLLSAPFLTGEELERLPSEDCARYFPDMEVDALPDRLYPEALDQGLLLCILKELLKGHRVVLHIDRQGDEAPAYSLRVLRRIYECLPYAMRRSCGFATNVAPERFTTTIESDRLPGAVQLCLVDADVELPDRVAGFTLLEMDKPYTTEELGDNLEFLQMLTVDSSARKNFFEVMQAYYGFSSASAEQYRSMFKLATDLEQPASVKTIEIWADDYGALPKIRSTICGRVAEKLSLPMAEEALRSAQFPELEKVRDLAGNERLTAAWELRMLSAIYANDPQAILQLAKTVTDRYSVLCREQTNAFRRGYGFATPESKNLMQKKAHLHLESALRLPAKYQDNKIVEALGQMLLPAIQKLADAETASYEAELQREQHHAVELVQRCTDLHQLVRLYAYLNDPKVEEYPLCRDVLAAGSKFSAQDSYGPDCLDAMAKRVSGYSLPTHLSDMRLFCAQVKELTESALYKEKLDGKPVIQEAVKPAEKLVCTSEMLRSVYRDGSVQEWMCTMAELVQRADKWKILPEKMHDEVFTCLCKKLTKAAVKAEDLFACTEALQQITAKEPSLLTELLERTNLLDVDIDNQKQAALLLANGSQWTILCGKKRCKTTFCPADRRCEKQRIRVESSPEIMLDFLKWHHSHTDRGAVPKIALELTWQAPDWLLEKYATDPKRIAEILQSLSPCDVKNRFVRELLNQPMPSAEVGGILIRALKKSGLAEKKVYLFCHTSWRGVIFAEYYDPMQGEQGALILALREKLAAVQQQAEQLYKREAETSIKFRDKQNARLKRQGNALSLLLTIFFAVYGLLPLLALWINGLLLSSAVQIWLVVELITAVLLELIGCVLLPLGLKENGRYIRFAALAGGVGLLPGILIDVAMMIFL